MGGKDKGQAWTRQPGAFPAGAVTCNRRSGVYNSQATTADAVLGRLAAGTPVFRVPEEATITASKLDTKVGQAAVAVRSTPHPVFWVIAACLLVIATSLVTRSGVGPLDGVAMGQLSGGAGARGVFALAGQLSKSTYGVYVVDTDAMTIWTYEYLPQKGCMRLAAARTWRYDRYLENHNVCDLPPEKVEEMVELQRQYRLEATDAGASQP